MPIDKSRDGLFWPSLFSVSSPSEQKNLKKRIQDFPREYNRHDMASLLIQATQLPQENDFRRDPAALEEACERVALKFLIQNSDFAQDFLSEEEWEKAQAVYGRGQYNSKILQKLLSYFTVLLRDRQSNLSGLFTLGILDEYRAVQDENTDKAFGKLKKLAKEVASGVKNICYSEAEAVFHPVSPLSAALNAFMTDRLGYDFNAASTLFSNERFTSLFAFNEQEWKTNQILKLALLPDEGFWQEHPYFSVTAFLNEIEKQNGSRHAEKLLGHLCDNLKKRENMEVVLQHSLPLYAALYPELVKALEGQAQRFTFKRLASYCDLTPLENELFCYPMSQPDDIENKLILGKEIWRRWLCEYNYPADGEQVINYLDEEVNAFAAGERNNPDEIAIILDVGPFRYGTKDLDQEIFSAYHPDCFSPEAIWKRVYLKACATTRLATDPEIQCSYLQRIFADIPRVIEKRIGICTKHQLDMSARNEGLKALKEKLDSFGVVVGHSRDKEYIVSLLDRDTAMSEEAELFPLLEQLGDAVYGLAAAELLFYNPKTVRMAEEFEKAICAEKQVAISKMIGFDRLYLAIGLPAKYTDYDTLFFSRESFIWKEEDGQSKNREKYLADSLEMILGTVCLEQGIETSLKLAKELLLKTSPQEFSPEVHPTEDNRHNPDIERDYWTKILPAPYTVMEKEHDILWRALDKLLLALILGTDTVAKRNFITHSVGDPAFYGESHGISWIFYDYLTGGLSFVLEKYRDKIRDRYENQ